MQLSKNCAAAWAADNIQVNTMLPGLIDTAMTKRLQSAPEFMTGDFREARRHPRRLRRNRRLSGQQRLGLHWEPTSRLMAACYGVPDLVLLRKGGRQVIPVERTSKGVI